MTIVVQIIEFTTSHIDEIDALADEMRAKKGTATVHRGMFTADRDRKNHYLSIIEFDSTQVAIDKMHGPEPAEFATKVAALCDGPPRFTISTSETLGPTNWALQIRLSRPSRPRPIG